MNRVSLFIVTVFSLLAMPLAQAQDIAACLSERVLSQSDTTTMGELKAQCRAELVSVESEDNQIFGRGPKGSVFPFSLHKKNFIAIGAMKNANGAVPFSGNDTDIKFQFSIKYQIFHPGDNGQLNFLAPLHFGYTQKSWWDIAEPSAPFAEHNFNPEIFWEFRNFKWNTVTLRNVAGSEHESNGRNGLESRSWNRAYWQGNAESSNSKYVLGLKVWHVIDEGIENNDITDYLGNGEFSFGYHFTRNFLLELTSTKGHEKTKINTKVDLIYRPSDKLNPRLFLTYYTGYGESLISYNVKTTSLRLGFDFPID